MEWSLKPRHVNEIRRVLDQFLTDHGVSDELLVRTRRANEELSREELTHAILGSYELLLPFSQKDITSLQFTRNRNGSPIEFVRINGKDAQTGSDLSHELNAIFTLIVNNTLPTLDRVMLTLLDFGKNVQSQLGGSRLSARPASFFQTFPSFQVPSPPFYPEVYGGGKNRDVTKMFVQFLKKGHIEHRRFKVVYQWGNTLRIDSIEISHPQEGYACFIAVNGIITVWHRDKNFSLQMA